jgi:putative zinc finger/helix-turn-helix YgiT family protein
MEIVTIPYEIQIDHYGRKHVVKIPDLSVAKCARCGNFVFDDEASEQVSRALRTAVGLLQPEEIQQHRERLGLSQAELADKLGVEPAELARWENGHQIQQRIADRYLRHLFAVPPIVNTPAQPQAANPIPS